MDMPKSLTDVTVDDNGIHIVVAADANYAMPMSVVLLSVASNCSIERHLSIHILECGFDLQLKHRVEKSIAQVRTSALMIYWHAVLPELISDLPIVQGHINPMTYARLLIPQLLPLSVTLALYLDSDLVVEGDVAELWDSFRADQALGAVRDRISVCGNKGGLSNYLQLGIRPDAPYFNAGVLMFNVHKWRQDSISHRVFTYLKECGDLVRFEDQEALNAVLHDDWVELNERWNQQITPRSLRNGSDVALPNLTPRGILHFITSEKPWMPGCEYIERRYFYSYLDLTDWKGWRLRRRQELYTRGRRTLGDVRRALLAKLDSRVGAL